MVKKTGNTTNDIKLEREFYERGIIDFSDTSGFKMLAADSIMVLPPPDNSPCYRERFACVMAGVSLVINTISITPFLHKNPEDPPLVPKYEARFFTYLSFAGRHYILIYQLTNAMTVNEILTQLQALGDEKVKAHNTKYGAPANQYGVKMGDIRTLAKKIKTNHELGLALWQTGNVEARLVAILVMKPKALSAQQLDDMVKSIDFSQVADWFNSYILKDHPEKETLREAWMDSDNVWAARAGWSLTAGRIARDAKGLDPGKILDRIESEMAHAAPEVQWTMNTTLAQIGIYFAGYRKRAMAIGEKLGIYRDYPVSKGCTSPFAPIWITEMVRRQEKA